MATDTVEPRPILRSRPEFAGILREQETYADGTTGTAKETLNSQFDRLMTQSGVGLSPSLMLMLSICSGITLGGLLFVIQENLLSTALAFAFGAVLPVAVTAILRSRRQSKILKQMPEMVDELARAARTGRSLEQCLALVAEDTPAPLGAELRLCTGKLEMGVGLRDALHGLPERTGVVSLNIFVMALIVHLTGGGDLVTVLERLARTIRERIQFLGRLQAATAASRATAILMLVLPPGIITFFALRDPSYLGRLMDSPWGRNVTVLALLLDMVGIFWVLRILKQSQRS